MTNVSWVGYRGWRATGNPGCLLEHATPAKVPHEFSGTKVAFSAAKPSRAVTNPLALRPRVSLSSPHAARRLHHRQLRPRRAAVEGGAVAPCARLLFYGRLPAAVR